ncbi:MAG TPA: hypothetical protein VJM31_18970 [Vicinamibacterales bacterium]|nr:hypothetical protein [Vicinamibacterales bacterium]
MTPAALNRPLDDSQRGRALPGARDWFLRDSIWTDDHWVFAPTSILEQERPVRLCWDFALPSGRRFTGSACAALLESSRRLVALIRARSLVAGLPQRATTVRSNFNHLRTLIRWMDREDVSRFSDLDAAAVRSFRRVVEQRVDRSGRAVSPATVQRHLHVLDYLHRFRETLGDGLTFDPWPGQSLHAAIGVRRDQRRAQSHTPDIVAIPLVQGAIDFLATSAMDILVLRESFNEAAAHASQRGITRKACYKAALRILRNRTVNTTRGVRTIKKLDDLAELVNLLYAACFTVLAYLLGARVSEILHLRQGCVQPLAVAGNSDHGIAVITGAILKLESAYHGRSHEWVAPPPAVHAIAVLEALSAPHRLRSSRDELWLRTRNHRLGAGEWREPSTAPLWVTKSERINRQLGLFGAWLVLPAYEGERWRLSSHQGRTTFAHFVGLRDRTSLFALAQHLGHRDRAITDASYVGNDYALHREIESEVLEQSVSAWELMLSARQLGGQAGREIVVKRPRFRGSSMKQDLKGYARMLVEAGLTLGVCDWGFCVYRQEYSACRGNALGPNPAGREPSTCVRCKNFVVSSAHRPYWQNQVRRYSDFLDEPALPWQTLKLVRERLSEAQAVLRSIESGGEEGS